MATYLTVVYKIDDPDSKEWNDEKERISKKFMTMSKSEKWEVTAMSADHEIRRVELIEEAVERGQLDAIEVLLGLVDVQLFNWDDDVEGCECHERDSTYVCDYCKERKTR